MRRRGDDDLPKRGRLTAITPRRAQNSSDLPPAELADQLWYLVTLTRVPSNTCFSVRVRAADLLVIGPQGQCPDVTKLEPRRRGTFEMTRGKDRCHGQRFPPGS
ncbi:MAG: hypothetical protein U0992_17460 [Planctomycetaceae bacterium]